MPEIAEVRTVAGTLNKSLAGRKIIDINVIYDKIIDEDVTTFKKNIIGQSIHNVDSYGKYLFFNLDGFTIVSHLRMEGKYFVKPSEDSIVKHEHIVFYLDNGLTLRYHDTRKFGRMFTCLREDVYNTKEISKLGLEPNDDKLIKEYLYDKIHLSKLHIKELLLDQTIICGLGNIYVDEILFASKIDPVRKGCDVTIDECQTIINESKRITDKATECLGTTIRSYTSSLGVYGTYQEYLCVHTKEGEPCPVCKTTIVKTRVGGRGTYYCPNCQK